MYNDRVNIHLGVQDMETIEVSFNGGLEKVVVHMYSGILTTQS